MLFIRNSGQSAEISRKNIKQRGYPPHHESLNYPERPKLEPRQGNYSTLKFIAAIGSSQPIDYISVGMSLSKIDQFFN
jgi:hypothetical protein